MELLGAAMVHFQVLGLLISGSEAFAPAPIRWMGLPARRCVLAPSVSSNRALVPPQPLTIIDEAMSRSSDSIPYFAIGPDKRIVWAAKGWCMEAGGDVGNLVRANSCDGSPAQEWNVLYKSPGQGMIQKTGTNKCLYVSDRDGKLKAAAIMLRDCDTQGTQAWHFEESIPLTKGVPSKNSNPWLQHAIMFSFVLAILGASSLGAWLWRWQRQACGICTVASQSSMPLDLAHGGLSLSIPVSVHEDRAHWTPNFNMTAPGMSPSLMPFSARAIENGSVALALRATTSMSAARNPHNLPVKTCVVCLREFTWRKKWEQCWDEVQTCSKRCNAERKILNRAARNAGAIDGRTMEVNQDGDNMGGDGTGALKGVATRKTTKKASRRLNKVRKSERIDKNNQLSTAAAALLTIPRHAIAASARVAAPRCCDNDEAEYWENIDDWENYEWWDDGESCVEYEDDATGELRLGVYTAYTMVESEPHIRPLCIADEEDGVSCLYCNEELPSVPLSAVRRMLDPNSVFMSERQRGGGQGLGNPHGEHAEIVYDLREVEISDGVRLVLNEGRDRERGPSEP